MAAYAKSKPTGIRRCPFPAFAGTARFADRRLFLPAERRRTQNNILISNSNF
jgi:hypothetical protein